MARQEWCQACNIPIAWGTQVIAVSYGVISGPQTPLPRVRKHRQDFFHKECAANVAIAQEE